MAIAQDTGSKNRRIDFVFGPFPPQPDDDRAPAALDVTLADHANITTFAWNGWPTYSAPNTSGTKLIVPTFVAGTTTKAQALTALAAVGITPTLAFTTAAQGCGTVVSVSPVAGTNLRADSPTVTLTLAGSPTANFRFAASDLVVAFTNTSTDTATNPSLTYAWDFGDAGFSTTASPSHTYARAGTYTVRLTATDAAGATNTVAKSVVVPNASPVADFTSVATLLSVAFTNTSTDSDGTMTYSWNFGDGTALVTTTSPTHVFAEAGTYSVSLTATDNDGSSDVETKSITVAAE